MGSNQKWQPQPVNDYGDLSFTQPGRDHTIPCVGEVPRDTFADAARATGDEHQPFRDCG